MKQYLVEMSGTVVEYYGVYADSEQEAIDNWASGSREHSEASNMEFVRVTLDYDDEETDDVYS